MSSENLWMSLWAFESAVPSVNTRTKSPCFFSAITLMTYVAYQSFSMNASLIPFISATSSIRALSGIVLIANVCVLKADFAADSVFHADHAARRHLRGASFFVIQFSF